MPDQVKQLTISIVVPVLNEEDSLSILYERLCEVLNTITSTYELIFVDDGSSDTSFDVLTKLHHQDKCVHIVQFRRNFGKAAALSAGFAEAQGDIVLTLDADLQDDPQEIPRFLAKLDEGYDLVSGWKYPRLDPISKTLPSKIFNFVTSSLTGVNLHDFNCGFKAYRSEVIQELHLYGELYRFIPALAHTRGFRVTEIKVKHHPRQYGQSKYGFSRMFRGFFDLITVLFLTQYIKRPLHLFGWFGVFCFSLGMIINSYMTILWIIGERPIGTRPLFSLGILLLIVGIQFFSFGLLADMITRLSSDKDYSVRKKLPRSFS